MIIGLSDVERGLYVGKQIRYIKHSTVHLMHPSGRYVTTVHVCVCVCVCVCNHPAIKVFIGKLLATGGV